MKFNNLSICFYAVRPSLNLVVVHLVPEEVAVGREGGHVAAGEVRHHEALPRERQIQRRRQVGGRVQRAQQVAEGRVHQDGTVWEEAG